MSTDFERLQDLFDRARVLSAVERSKFLARAGEQEKLLSAVRRLLRQYDAQEQPLEQPAICRFETVAHDASARFPNPSRLPPGTTVGGYEIIRRLGAGGMGVVYLAKQSDPARRVALKVIRLELANEELLKRFRFEASILARLQHPGIGMIFESGVSEIDTKFGVRSLPFLAMEWIEGSDLVTYCRELGTDDRIEVFCQVCDAIEHAHQSGFIHRDLKPGNILVQEGGRAKVLDFGVARALDPELQVTFLETQVGQIVGSIFYMSPEQITGDPRSIDHRCDVYSLGVILYELLAGKLPFDLHNRTLPEATRMIVEDDPRELSSIDHAYRGDLTAIVGKALEKRATDRYPSAAELAADLRRHLSHEPIRAHAPSRWYKLRKFSRRNRGLVTGLAIAATVLLLGTTISTTLAIRNGTLAQLANESEQAAERTTYRTSIEASLVNQRIRDFHQSLNHLLDAPEHLRHWEWHYLHSLATNGARLYDSESFSPAIFDESGIPIAALVRDGRIDVVDLESGQVRSNIPISKNYENVVVTKNCRRVIAYSRERSELKIWDLENQRLERSMTAETHARVQVPGVRATANEDGSIVAVDFGPVIETSSGKTLDRMDGFVHEIRGDQLLAYDGRVLETKHSKSWLRLIRLRTGTESPLYSLKTNANGVSWSHDGSRFVFKEKYGRVHVIDEKWDLVSTLRTNDSQFRVAMDMTGPSRLWQETEDHGIELLELLSGESIVSIPTGIDPEILSVAPDERSVTITGRTAVEYREIPRGPQVLRGHTNFVYSVCFSPDGSMILSGSWDGSARLWEVATGEELARFRTEDLPSGDPQHVRGAGFSSDGQSVLVGLLHRLTRHELWRSRSVIEWVLEAPRREAPSPIVSSFLQSCAPGSKIWAHSSGERQATSFDHQLLVHANWETGVIQIAPLSESADAQHTLPGHKGGTTATAFDRSGRLLASGGRVDGTITIWDLDTGRRLFDLHGHVGSIFSVSFHPDGKRLASGGRDGLLRIWNLETRALIASFEGHEEYIHSVEFSPDGTRIASGSGDGTVRIWDSASRKVRREEHEQALTNDRLVIPTIQQLITEFGPETGAEKALQQFPSDSAQQAAVLRQLLRNRPESTEQRKTPPPSSP